MRFARGTIERSKEDVRAAIAASVDSVPPPRIVLVPPWPVPDPTSFHDVELLAILDEPLLPGETALAGYTRKEGEIGAVFAAFAVPAARAMHARLSAGHHGDPLVERFSRLTIERRVRLLNFLADARRRAAIASARR